MMPPRLSGLLAGIIIILLILLFFWKILLTNLILVGVDSFLFFYPYKAYASEALRQGRLPLWNPHLFMGAPLLANSQVGVLYPLNWPWLWLDPPKQVAWSIGLHLALAGIFMLAYIRQSLQLSWAAALVGAILFALGGYLSAQVEHINQLNAAAWLPLLFLLYDYAVRPKRRWLWVLLLGSVTGLTLLAGHTQTVFISLFGLGLYALWRIVEVVGERIGAYAVEHKWRMAHGEWRVKLRSFAIHLFATCARRGVRSFTYYLSPLLIASILAVGLAAMQLFPTAELSSLSIRSSGLSLREALSFRLQPSLLLYTLLPPFGLDLSQRLGEAFGEWVAYLGVTGLGLALVGMGWAVWRSQIRRYIFLAGCGLILSLGLPYIILYYVVPGFNLFRVPARWLLLYTFGMAILAGYGLDALQSPQARSHLSATWRWLQAGWWRKGLLIGLPVILFFGLLAWNPPPWLTLMAWFALALVALFLFRSVLYRGGGHSDVIKPQITQKNANKYITSTIILLLLAELFWAAQNLNYNQATAPQAYHSFRNAPAFLLATDPPGGFTPPGRFLSLSGITYDPGDLKELQQIFGASLSPKALYNLIVATKEKEVLFYNLPMNYGLHSVDGYDGGLLPLQQFITMQKLFLPADDLSIDGRLREKLRVVPPGRLLSLLNTRWIITDKQFDVWIDNIFYDLQFPARLRPGQSIAVTPTAANAPTIPDFPTTAVGLVSHLEGAANLPAATVVAHLELTFSNGASQTIYLKAGSDTAEGNYPGGAAHPQAKIGVAWPYQADGVDYISIYPLNASTSQRISRMKLTATLPAGQFVLRGLSLINQATATSRSVILTTAGVYRQVHSGDVKIYENLAVQPRAFVVHAAEVVQSDEQAIALLQDPTFDPAQTLVRLAQANEQPGPISLGQASPADQVTITSYQLERVELMAKLNSPGWLVLTDTIYPGWQATLDGQPTAITPVNLMFRAVTVPAGEHNVVFEYRPRSVQLGAWVSGLTALAVIINLAFIRFGWPKVNIYK
jgi:hypothetical protein